jgi:hypothetical protein
MENFDELIKILHTRFEKNMQRHKGISWGDIAKKLDKNSAKLNVLAKMEKTGGEPDVIEFDKKTGDFMFCDCAAESPLGRRNLCYDRKALNDRKEFKPANSVLDVAAEIGITLLTEADYRKLQELGNFDTKTSSWIFTPAEIRKLGGAIFADRRYNQIFVYHNGASSYYAARGFRGILNV